MYVANCKRRSVADVFPVICSAQEVARQKQNTFECQIIGRVVDLNSERSPKNIRVSRHMVYPQNIRFNERFLTVEKLHWYLENIAT